MESDVKADEVLQKVKKELPQNLQKICLVCGDRALGYNFNAISCESCKAFFRRNALSNKQLKCPFANKCDITSVTRRFCQKCRLQKCLTVGMMKEFIMSEEDKAEKRKKIDTKKSKKRPSNHSDESTVSSSKNCKLEDDISTSSNFQQLPDASGIQYNVLNSTTCSPSATVQSSTSEVDGPLLSPPICPQYEQTHNEYQPYGQGYQPKTVYNESVASEYSIAANSMDSMYSSDIQKSDANNIKSLLTSNEIPSPPLMRDEQHVCEEMPSTSSPDANKARDILQDVERIEPNSIESILCEAIKLEFEAYTSVNPCGSSSRELNEVERAKLNELIVANKALHDPIDDDITLLAAPFRLHHAESEGKHDPELINIVNFTALAIRRLIKMAKKISAFRNMCEEDQVALLKGGCIEMMVLRSTMTYDGQRNSWKIPHSRAQFGSIKTDVLKLASGGGGLYAAHEAFIGSFEPRWRHDEAVILVLSAILLFTPTRARLVHTDVVKLEQNSYYYLLRRYLESTYRGCEAKATFLKLIQKIMELRKLSAQITGVYLDVNPIEPLLMEIFDLKHHNA